MKCKIFKFKKNVFRHFEKLCLLLWLWGAPILILYGQYQTLNLLEFSDNLKTVTIRYWTSKTVRLQSHFLVKQDIVPHVPHERFEKDLRYLVRIVDDMALFPQINSSPRNFLYAHPSDHVAVHDVLKSRDSTYFCHCLLTKRDIPYLRSPELLSLILVSKILHPVFKQFFLLFEQKPLFLIFYQFVVWNKSSQSLNVCSNLRLRDFWYERY